MMRSALGSLNALNRPPRQTVRAPVAERILADGPLHLFKFNRIRIAHLCCDSCLCFFYHRLVVDRRGWWSLRLRFRRRHRLIVGLRGWWSLRLRCDSGCCYSYAVSTSRSDGPARQCTAL